MKIAEKILYSIESGQCGELEKETTLSLKVLPEEIDLNTGKPAKPAGLMYPFTVENAKAFANFCLTCGGFMFLQRKN